MDGHYRRCADCDTEYSANTMYRISAPLPDARLFFLCKSCWDKMISLAVMAAMRSM